MPFTCTRYFTVPLLTFIAIPAIVRPGSPAKSDRLFTKGRIISIYPYNTIVNTMPGSPDRALLPPPPDSWSIRGLSIPIYSRILLIKYVLHPEVPPVNLYGSVRARCREYLLVRPVVFELGTIPYCLHFCAHNFNAFSFIFLKISNPPYSDRPQSNNSFGFRLSARSAMLRRHHLPHTRSRH